jgi:dihydroorotase-like cyclic amidohydrolase
LFRLVGVDPPLKPEADREALREAVVNWFGTK